MNFMKNVEIFLTVLLKDLKHDLKVFCTNPNYDDQAYQRMLLKYQKIHDLTEEFNKAFGVQMTVTTFGFFSDVNNWSEVNLV